MGIYMYLKHQEPDLYSKILTTQDRFIDGATKYHSKGCWTKHLIGICFYQQAE